MIMIHERDEDRADDRIKRGEQEWQRKKIKAEATMTRHKARSDSTIEWTCHSCNHCMGDDDDDVAPLR